MPGILQGHWTYRSFFNNAVPVGDNPQAALDLIFGEGDLNFTSITGSNFQAVLDFGGGAAMDLYGTQVPGNGINPTALVITGTGRAGTTTDKWVYQYQGYLAPTWPQGVQQTAAIVGTVVRTIPHGSGAAGVVVSFMAIKRT